MCVWVGGGGGGGSCGINVQESEHEAGNHKS